MPVKWREKNGYKQFQFLLVMQEIPALNMNSKINVRVQGRE